MHCTELASYSMADKESTGSVVQEVLEAVSGGRRDLKIVGVQLKIVGEDLRVFKEFKHPLELSFSCQGPACVISFHDGTPERLQQLLQHTALLQFIK